VPALVVAAALLGTWYLLRLWNGSRAPEAARRVGDMLRLVWKALLAVAALGVVAAMVQGCEGNDPSSGGSGTSGDGPRYEPCPAFHEEDCPLAPADP
jgi:hypothetical protein